MTYPVLALAPDGFAFLLPSPEVWESMPYGYRGLFNRRRAALVLFGKDGTKWRLERLEPREPVGILTRVFQGTRRVPMRAEIIALGPCDAAELKAAFRAAVVADDDILCQYYSKEQILAWIDRAESIAKLFNVYNWISKESFKRVRSNHDVHRTNQHAPR